MTEQLDIYSLIGFVGTACIIGAYFYLTAVEKPNPFVLHGTNLAGAALLTISLLVHTNIPSLVLEGFWAAIALWGLWKSWRNRSASYLQEGSGDGLSGGENTRPPPASPASGKGKA